MVWYPPGFPWVEPLVWEPRGGTPLLCCVNDRVRASPFHGRHPTAVSGEVVAREGGLVLDFGLFPVSDLGATILVESSGCPSGYGSWRLTAGELANLWDVPILFLDLLSDQEISGLMGDICSTPPSKLLHTGADVLLTDGFRGVEGVFRGGGGFGSTGTLGGGFGSTGTLASRFGNTGTLGSRLGLAVGWGKGDLDVGSLAGLDAGH